MSYYYRFFIPIYTSINKEPRGTEQYKQQALIYRDMNSGLQPTDQSGTKKKENIKKEHT
jgi:hypothetical protein